MTYIFCGKYTLYGWAMIKEPRVLDQPFMSSGLNHGGHIRQSFFTIHTKAFTKIRKYILKIETNNNEYNINTIIQLISVQNIDNQSL